LNIIKGEELLWKLLNIMALRIFRENCTHLYADGVTKLPELLTSLYADSAIELPKLPKGLVHLYAYNVTELPELPKSLIYLFTALSNSQIDMFADMLND
jgi:hypothetical protein